MESRIITALAQFWRGQVDRIRAALEPVVPSDRKAKRRTWRDALDAAFWSEEERELLAVMWPLLTEGAVAGVDGHAADIEAMGLGIDWNMPHTEAAKWARKYSSKLITGITDTTRKRVAGLVGDWIDTPGRNLGELYADLQRDYGFNERRARLIAITETTRSYAGGELVAAESIEAEGLFTYNKRWQTNNDELVCPICAPLNQQVVAGVRGIFETGAGPLEGPPAHPGCRCWVGMEPVVPT